MHKLLIIVIRIKSVKEFTNYWEGSNYSLDKYKTRFFHKKENSDSFFLREREKDNFNSSGKTTNKSKGTFFFF